MADKFLVSIIMAVKDTEPYLPACLDSIQRQTYKNWELIAVNDHSTDASLEILEAYAAGDDRIKVYKGEGHRLIPTLQQAYTNATGVLINRMDSDDIMPEDKLEILATEWVKYGKGHVIAGGTKHFVDQGTVGNGFIQYENWLNKVAKNSTHYQEIYKECVIPSHCWIIHKEDFDAVGAFEPLIYPEDYDLCFRFYQNRLKIIGIDKILHFWRDRSNRISRTWEEYKDNRYFDLKLGYFIALDYDKERPLVLWGAGRNGKDLAKGLIKHNVQFTWVSDNEKKIGKDIYGVQQQHFNSISQLNHPQIVIVVTSPEAKIEIKKILDSWHKLPVKDYWFFL